MVRIERTPDTPAASLPSEDDVLRMAEAQAAEHVPTVMLASVRDLYGGAKRAEAFELGAVMIGEPELARLETIYVASDLAIERLRAKLDGLPRELEALEAANRAKLGEAQTISAEIAERMEALSKKHEQRGRFAKIMVALGVADSFEDAKRYDPRLAELEADRKRVERERIEISTTLIRRNTPRPMIEEKLGELARVAGELYSCLEVDPPARGAGWAGVAAIEARVERRRRLIENLEAQIAVLESSAGEARTLGENLDDLIAQLRGMAAAVRELHAAAEVELMAAIGELGIAGDRALFGRAQSFREPPS